MVDPLMLRYVITRLVYTSIALVVISEFQLQDPAYLLTYSCADREHHRMPEGSTTTREESIGCGVR
jgi:hypothetical protein